MSTFNPARLDRTFFGLTVDVSFFSLQWQFSVVTPRSKAPSPLNSRVNPLLPPSPTISPAMIRRRSGECTSISSGIIPTAAPVQARTVSRRYCPEWRGYDTATIVNIYPYATRSPTRFYPNNKRTNGVMNSFVFHSQSVWQDPRCSHDDERHVGDLGNFSTDAQGNAKATITDSLVKLIGPESILGVCDPFVVDTILHVPVFRRR